MDIYICSKKIVDTDFLDYFVICHPISVMGDLRKFLVFSEEFECADGRGTIRMKFNSASNHFVIFGKEFKKFINMVDSFCRKQTLSYFDFTDKDALQKKETIFFTKNQKIKNHLDSLKDDYEIARANKQIFKMAKLIETAENIVSGKIKI